MDIKKTISNPWVLGGGAVLALVLVLGSRSGSSDGGASAVISAQAANNAAGMNYAANMAGIAATTNLKNIDAETQKTLGFLSFAQMMFEVQEVNQTQRGAVAADVVKTRITTDAARQIEQMSIFERMQNVWVSGNVAKHGQNVNADVAKYGMRTAADTAMFSESHATQRALGESQIKAGSDALGNILKFATGFFGK